MGYSLRSSDELQVICNNGQQYTFAGSMQVNDNVCDSGILTATDKDGKQTFFFKSVLSICQVTSPELCANPQDGRNLTDFTPHLVLSGMVQACGTDNPYATILAYPAQGQTLDELHNEILNLIGRLCD